MGTRTAVDNELLVGRELSSAECRKYRRAELYGSPTVNPYSTLRVVPRRGQFRTMRLSVRKGHQLRDRWPFPSIHTIYQRSERSSDHSLVLIHFSFLFAEGVAPTGISVLTVVLCPRRCVPTISNPFASHCGASVCACGSPWLYSFGRANRLFASWRL